MVWELNFATYSTYSHSYAHVIGDKDSEYDGCHQIFVARVLVGRYAVGNSALRRPPPIDTSKPDDRLYDSTVDNISNPLIYVIFNNHQAYPAYLITYKTK